MSRMPARPLLALASGSDHLRSLGRPPRTLTIGGVRFPHPGPGNRHAPGHLRDQAVRLRPRVPQDRPPWRIVGVDPATLTPPLVLVRFHLEPVIRLRPFVMNLPGPTVIAVDSPAVERATPWQNTVMHPTRTEADRVHAFVDALHALRAGGFALIAVDGAGSSQVPATIFGRQVALSRGAFALANLAGAPVLPIAARWRRTAVEIVGGELIPPEDPAVMAESLGRWLEDYLRRHPQEFSVGLASLLGEPL